MADAEACSGFRSLGNSADPLARCMWSEITRMFGPSVQHYIYLAGVEHDPNRYLAPYKSLLAQRVRQPKGKRVNYR